jgi:protein-ribulosamine 3-kinase
VKLPIVLQKELEDRLQLKITSFRQAAGGCINWCGQIQTPAGNYFVKWNNLHKYPNMFAAEQDGLNRLAQTRSVRVPHTHMVFAVSDWQVLVLEYIPPGRPRPDYWEKLGEQLADLHRNSASAFGLDRHNYIGSLPQINDTRSSWVDFFIQNRLEYQLKMAEAGGWIDASLRLQFESLYRKLPDLMPEEPPALLHGDLWSGNLMTDAAGFPCMVDPAVYYGHREAELSFTRLFGGFDDRFYDAYHTCFPLQRDWESRVDLYNLYPLLVHVNLFGGGYLASVINIIHRYTT